MPNPTSSEPKFPSGTMVEHYTRGRGQVFSVPSRPEFAMVAWDDGLFSEVPEFRLREISSEGVCTARDVRGVRCSKTGPHNRHFALSGGTSSNWPNESAS